MFVLPYLYLYLYLCPICLMAFCLFPEDISRHFLLFLLGGKQAYPFFGHAIIADSLLASSRDLRSAYERLFVIAGMVCTRSDVSRSRG